MSKFCTNCGNALEENVKFCTGCGTAVEAEPAVEAAPVAPVAEQTPVVAAPAKAAPSFDFKKLLENKKLLAIAGAAVAVVVILILVLTLGGGKSAGYMSAVDNYMDYTLGTASKSQVENLLPEEMWLSAQAYQQVPMDELLEQFMSQMEQREKTFESRYGENIRVDYEVVRTWTVSDKLCEMASDYLVSKYGFEEGCVSDIHKLEMEATIKGDLDEEEDEMNFYVLKINGKWYLANVGISEGNAYVYFALNIAR